jgi:CBS domain containing-hemolysin-like protein
MPDIVSLLAVPALIAINAFFVAAEYAIVASKSPQVEQLRQRGWNRSAEALRRLKEHPASSIGTIQVCITMTNLLLGWIGEPAMSQLLQSLFAPAMEWAPGTMRVVATALSFLVVTLLTVVFSELLPKALTLRHVAPAAAVTAPLILNVQWLLSPLVWVMNRLANLVTVPARLGKVEELEEHRLTLEDLGVLAREAAADGVVTESERSLILNSLAIGRRQARQIMVPRLMVKYLDLQRSMDENRAEMGASLFSRMPLCDGGMDNVVGLIETKEFLTAFHAAGDSSVLNLIAKKMTFVPDRVQLDRLLETLRRERTQFVCLVNEYGVVQGIVTLQDVVDELLGTTS